MKCAVFLQIPAPARRRRLRAEPEERQGDLDEMIAVVIPGVVVTMT